MTTENLRDMIKTTDRPLPAVMKYVGILCLALVVALASLNAGGAFGQSTPSRVDRAQPGSERESGSSTSGATAIEQPLDMESLKQRLRDTGAIGFFSKLALRNQMDDLVLLFRVHYATGQKTDIALLRPPYNMLVLKVLALVQDGDPPLARTIAGSREALWLILADPQKFKLIT